MTAKELLKKPIENRTEKDWNAIGDAHTLARALLIREDPKRLKAAQLWAAALAIDEMAEGEALKRVGNA